MEMTLSSVKEVLLASLIPINSRKTVQRSNRQFVNKKEEILDS